MTVARQDNIKLFVGNLSFYTQSETLEEVFEEFGEVLDCYIPTDINNGDSRGFGFVTMEKDPANAAVEGLNGFELDGRIISVNEARPRAPKEGPSGDSGVAE
jgi:cold-inducible RNA-binding protein